MKISILSLFFILSISLFAQKIDKPLIIESTVKKHTLKTGKLAAVGALIWSENFEGSGNTFPYNGISSTSKDAVDKGFQRGDSSNSNLGQVFKVPNHTRFAFTNDDDCNCNKYEDELILPSISFSGTNGAIFRFSAYFNRVLSSESAKVYVELGSGWLQIAEIAPDQNWKDYEVLVAGGSILNPKFKFVYSDDSSWASGLAIDDIEIYKPDSILDLRIDSVTVNNQNTTDFYKRIPRNQASALHLETEVKVSNISNKTGPNTFVTSEISGQKKASEWAYLGNFAPLSVKNGTTFSKHSLSNGIGKYSITSYLHSDSIDSDLSNDTLSFDIDITDTIYSRTNQNVANRGFWYGPHKNYGILSLFVISSKTIATSISIYLHQETNVGDSIDVLIFSEFLQDVVKDSFPQINENIVLKKEHIGNWVTFKIPESKLKPGKYFVGLRTRGKKVVVGVSDNPVKKNLVIANTGTGFGSVDYLPFVTLNLKSTSCPILNMVPAISKSTCGAINGQIVLSVTGGTPAYRYQWGRNGSYSTLNAINGIGAGVYDVTVTDSLGCSASASYAVSDSSNIHVDLDSIRHEKCFGDSLGYLQIGVSNGVAPYNIVWESGSSDTILTKQTSGNYQVTVTDASGSGCKSISTFEVLGPYDSLRMISQTGHNYCFSDKIGFVKTKIFGGFGVYNYQWSSSSINGANLNSLKTGKYSLTVTDANACTITGSFEVESADSLGMTGVVYDTGGTASIIISLVGGSTPYSYAWKGPVTSGFINPGTKDLFGLIDRGRYTLTVTDSLGCTVVDTFIVAGNVSIQSISSQRKVGVYPNPSKGVVKIKVDPDAEVDVLVLDELGRKVQVISSYQNQSIFLNEGLYFFQMEENGIYLNTIKVLVIN